MAETNSQSEQWQHRISTWKQTGQSAAQFCRDNNLSYHQFGYWSRKLAEASPEEVASRPSAGFAQVQYQASEAPELSLSLPSGITVKGICVNNIATVRRLLEVL